MPHSADALLVAGAVLFERGTSEVLAALEPGKPLEGPGMSMKREGLVLLDKAVAVAPRDLDLLIYRARAFESADELASNRAEHVRDCIDAWNRVLAVAPNLPLALRRLADHEASQGVDAGSLPHLDRALEMVERAYRLSPPGEDRDRCVFRWSNILSEREGVVAAADPAQRASRERWRAAEREMRLVESSE